MQKLRSAMAFHLSTCTALLSSYQTLQAPVDTFCRMSTVEGLRDLFPVIISQESFQASRSRSGFEMRRSR